MLENMDLADHEAKGWSGTQVEFVTIVLAMGMIAEDVDAVGESMVQTISFDIAPYPDFRSMRLALQDQCDPAAFMAMGKKKLQEELPLINALDDAGISLDTTTDGLGQTLEFFNHYGLSTRTMQPVEPLSKFITLPPADEPWLKMTWYAGLAEFTQLVFISEMLGLLDIEGVEMDGEAVLHWYCLHIAVELGSFTDFRSLSAVYSSPFDIELVKLKTARLTQAQRITRDLYVGEYIRPLSNYMNQKVFNMKVANALVERQPTIEPDALAYVFDLLFVSDDMLDGVLGDSKNLS